MSGSRRYKGILYIVLSAFCFALMNLFVRLAGDLPSIQKSFFRNFVAAIFVMRDPFKRWRAVSVQEGESKVYAFAFRLWDAWNSLQFLCSGSSGACRCVHAK